MLEKIKSNRKIIYIIRMTVILFLADVVCLVLNYLGVEKENILMVFMVGVLMISTCTRGYEYGLIGAAISVLTFNYLFTVPVHTFAIMNPNDMTLMVFFVIASLISSSLAVRFQKQLIISKKNEETATRLYEMSEQFINVTGKENIIQLGIHCIYEYTGFECVVELQDDTVISGTGNEYTSKDYLMFPIIGIVKQIGIMKILNHNQGLSVEQELIVKTAANQIGIALDRELIYTQQEQIKVEVEREHMKSSMLRSISHDFRTPLTGIMGDCAILLDSERVEDEVSRQLIRDVMEQSMWLMKMMENILSMTKIESGQTYIHKSPEVVDDVINEASGHVIGLKDRRHYRVSLPDEVIVAEMDGKMIAQVIINILDNAVKHTQEDGEITLKVKYRNLRVYFIIEDDGEGVPESLQDRIFDEFVSTSDKSTDQKRGIGLGLAICKAVVTAHGGEIWEENRENGGARFVFWLPAKQAEEDGKEKDINCGR